MGGVIYMHKENKKYKKYKLENLYRTQYFSDPWTDDVG
jgi:hypothetical protein